jgi:hypothetical protein
MVPTAQQFQPNPLASFMRQPKIYIRLPSNGQFWPAGSLEMSENGELPVFSMTAKDELMLKVPDAVMSGQAVVDVIQHCIPNIKNAWMVPSIDIDVLLIAIRLATYGEKMTTPITFGEDIEMEYTTDLRTIMDSLMQNITWENAVQVSQDLTVYVRPLNYKQISESAVKTFETQKILQIANDAAMSEADKIAAFKESFSKLSDVTIGIVEKSIYKIDSTSGGTEDPRHIKEFIDNADKDIFNIVQNHIEHLREANSLKPITVQVTDEMRANGITGETIDVPLVFDPATFFV